MTGSIKNVLLLENNHLLLRILSEYLQLSGYSTFTATSTVEAREILARQTIDLILSDYNLEEHQTGLAFIRNMQRIGECQLGILMSGVIREEEIDQSEMGDIQLLLKPFTRDDLISVIESLTEPAEP